MPSNAKMHLPLNEHTHTPIKVFCYLLATRCLSLTWDLSNQMWCEDLTMALWTIPSNPPCTWPTSGTSVWGKKTLEIRTKRLFTLSTEHIKHKTSFLPVSSGRRWPGWWRRWALCGWPHRCRRSLVCSLWNETRHKQKSKSLPLTALTNASLFLWVETFTKLLP